MKTDPFNGETITKAELINLMKDLDPDDKICLASGGSAYPIKHLYYISEHEPVSWDTVKNLSDKDEYHICLGAPRKKFSDGLFDNLGG